MKWFANMKISKKLLLGFAIVLAVAVALGVVGYFSISNIASNDEALYTQNTLPIGTLTDMTATFQTMRVNLREVILQEDLTTIKDYMQKVSDQRTKLEALEQEFAKMISTDQIQKAYDDLLQKQSAFNGYADQLVAYGEQNMNTKAVVMLSSDEVFNAEQDAQNAILTLVDLLKKEAANKFNENKALGNAANMTVMGAVLIGVILALFLAFAISNMISKSMKKIIVAAEGIADGDLDVDVSINTKDEIGDLARAFRRMSDNLNEVLSGIRTAADQVASGAKQLSESSASLSQGASEQASSIEEVTASLEQISSQTSLNAKNASDANRLAGVARGNAEQGNGQMKEMLKAMEEINISSANISKIIKVIDDIAFQTNILALNAAVEAARAGQHGKGFAVVAEEVRNLAAKSAKAAKETTDLIEGSILKVEAGTKLATHTADALEKIVGNVAQAASLVNQIDTASSEQSIGLTQVNQAVLQVSQVVQANSAVSEQSAAASKELSGQAEMMRESVGRFKLKQGADTKDRAVSADAKAQTVVKPVHPEKQLKRAHGKPSIALSDEEFGKY